MSRDRIPYQDDYISRSSETVFVITQVALVLLTVPYNTMMSRNDELHCTNSYKIYSLKRHTQVRATNYYQARLMRSF